MSLINIEAINMIPQIMEKIESLNLQLTKINNHLEPKYDLTKRAGVMNYLNISNSTIERYIKEGIFIKGYHYHREIKQSKPIIRFVSGAIEEFKKEKTK